MQPLDHVRARSVGVAVLLFACALAGLAGTPAMAKSHKKAARDRDRDGLSDRLEVRRYRTNPRRKDTDRDGLTDGAEVRRYKTSPRRKDADRDGLTDGAEVRRYKTNPRRRDTDRDGLSDGAEVRRFKTNPRRRDTDGDGTPDGAEILLGTNPRVRNAPGGGAGGGGAGGATGGRFRPVRACTSVVTSVAAAQSAVAAAAPGAVVCLANGSYGNVSLSATKPAEVVLQAQNPGGATIAGASLAGRWLTLASFNVTGEVTIQPAAEHVTVEFNRISGGYYGVNAGPTTDTNISDTTVVGNRFVGPFGEDAFRLNRYHDGPDGDPYGMLISGNEITGVRENGNHSDCLQSVWGGDHLYFTRNYLHDNRCQGFFVKDQPANVDTVVVQDNLFLRNAAPCGPPATSCGQPAIVDVFGPLSVLLIDHNTIWTPEGGSSTVLQGTGWGRVDLTNNVISRLHADVSSPFVNYGATNNLVAQRELTWPTGGLAIGTPAFPDPASGDYRIAGRGVTWRVADQPYGP